MKRYCIAVDIGGTFVDSILFDLESGAVRLAKASTTPEEPNRGVMEGLRRLGVDLANADTFVHGTTLGLNAVIERRGAPTGIITNAGFRDIFEIGRGSVPDASMYDHLYRHPELLVRRRWRIGVSGRLDAAGVEIEPLDEDAVLAAAEYLLSEGVQSVAISFLHSYRNTVHEDRAAHLIREKFPNLSVSTSSSITREYREYERTATAVMDAYISPIFGKYIEKLEGGLIKAGFDSRFMVMRSAGGAMSAAAARATPIYTLMSGPAGGVIGAAHLASLLGKKNVLTLDYGGTSLDLTVIEDMQPTVKHEAELENFPAQIPIFDIRCIGAGGGSIAWLSEGLLQVGPQSAGANPGPAAYGRGGTEPTTTDAALILGFLDPDAFLGGALKLEADLSRQAMQKIAEGLGVDVTNAAAGVFDVLTAHTAGAIREITVERGRDPREFSMLAFGGAGPMIAPIIAREVDNFELIVPQAPAVFSAWGMLMSDLVTDAAQTDIRLLDEDACESVKAGFASLVERATVALTEQGVGQSDQSIDCMVECRYVGQEHVLVISVGDGPLDVSEVRRAFDDLHRERFGHAMADPVQLVTLRVRGSSRLPKPPLAELPRATSHAENEIVGQREAFCFATRAVAVFDVYERSRLAPGHRFNGPAIIEEGVATTVIHSDQFIVIDDYGNLIIRKAA